MSIYRITKITGDIKGDSFDCGNESINNMVLQSYYPTLLHHAFTFEFSAYNKTLGFYMVNFSNINIDDCPSCYSDYCDSAFKDFCSLNIKFFAVDKQFQGKGIGTNIFKVIIKQSLLLSERNPIRFITIDALKDKYSWYEKLGFVAFDDSDIEKETVVIRMYIDCLKNIESVHNYLEAIS